MVFFFSCTEHFLFIMPASDRPAACGGIVKHPIVSSSGHKHVAIVQLQFDVSAGGTRTMISGAPPFYIELKKIKQTHTHTHTRQSTRASDYLCLHEISLFVATIGPACKLFFTYVVDIEPLYLDSGRYISSFPFSRKR